MAAVEQQVEGRIVKPYVGPRTFRADEANLFFGREREARELISLIIAKRLVLFYAQSGAGKSSLLNTRIVPGLTTEGFEVLPIGGVRGASGLEVRADNIYSYNLMLSLHQSTEIPPSFETLSLPSFLDNLVFAGGKFFYDPQHEYAADESLKPRILLVDQFEEILTTNPACWEHRGDFFEQLARALELDDHLWIVLTMREDFVAALEPFLHHLPGRLSDRYHMRRLEPAAALEAIRNPAEKAGRPFVAGAAERLVDSLRQIRLPGRENEILLGEFVEPVQLQTVCFQMWESLKAQPGDRISEQNVLDYADVDRALAQFYEATVFETVAQTGVSEIDLRDWFERDLVTEAGTRGIVYRGDEVTGRLPTSVADCVNTKFMLRTEVRAGGAWYELVHDRFIQPILVANGEWRLKQPLIQLAQEWKDAGHREDNLLAGALLTSYLDTNWRALGSLVAEYMQASQAAQVRQEKALTKEREEARQRELTAAQALAAEAEARRLAEARRADEQARSAQNLRRRNLWLAGALAVATLTMILAVWLGILGQRSANMEAIARETAVWSGIQEAIARQTAVADAQLAAQAGATAIAERAVAREHEATAVAERARAQQQLTKRLALDAKNLANTELDKSLLLSLSIGEALSRTLESDGSLIGGLTHDLEMVTYLQGQNQPVTDLAVSPAGLLAAAGNLDGSIVIWDTKTPQMQPITLTTGLLPIGVTTVAWAQHKDVLGFGNGSGQVGLWQFGAKPTFELFQRQHSFVGGYSYPVSAAAISADDQLLASGSCANFDTGLSDCISGEIALWDIADGNTQSPISPTAILTGLQSVTEDLAFHPSLLLLASAGCGARRDDGRCGQGQIQFWDVEHLKPIGAPLNGHTDEILAVAFSPDGTTLASAGRDGTVILWTLGELSSTTPISTVLPVLHTSWVYDLAYNADGSLLASSSCASFGETSCNNGEIFIWDTATNRLVDFIESHSAEVNALAFRTQLLASGGADGQVILHDLALQDTFVKRLAGHNTQVNMVAFNPASALLASAGSNEIRIWDVTNAQPATSPLTGTAGVFLSVAFSPDGSTLAAGDDSGHLWCWEMTKTKAWKPLGPLPPAHDTGITALAYQPDGHLLASGSQDGSVAFWDTTTYTVTARRQVHNDFVSSLAFSPAGEAMLSGSGDGSMALWDMQTLTVTALLGTGVPGAVDDVSFSFDGQLLASADRSGTPFLWDKASLVSQNPQRLPIAPGATAPPTWRIAFSPVSPLLAGGSTDGKILLWDTEKMLPIGDPIQGHRFSSVTDVAVSPDGRWLASSDSNGAVLLWPLEYDVWRKKACQIANSDLTAAEWSGYFGDQPQIAVCP